MANITWSIVEMYVKGLGHKYADYLFHNRLGNKEKAQEHLKECQEYMNNVKKEFESEISHLPSGIGQVFYDYKTLCQDMGWAKQTFVELKASPAQEKEEERPAQEKEPERLEPYQESFEEREV
jgi:uncharacterized membrane-anchored protein YhcB (DUF1043 family)